ncbi:DUF6580 family putative transport protein [Pseudopedobacter beijingensis]|uniref:DUF6580 family putative transport protein n=1 Tax=Pseudopedobacter beijingensis TaxID=1207056 RepID=A0ABW4IGN9_9SPHI
MSINKIQVQNGLLLLIILIAVSFRFVDMGENYAWANFTPVGAIALFAGTYFKDKRKSFIVPLAVLLLSDVLLMHKYTGSFNPYYSGIELVYLSFAVMVYLGSRIKKVNVLNVFLVSVLSVLVHWLLTDIHPWLSGPYTKDFSGYIAALVAAIPFEKNLLFGNLVFSLLMYGGYEVVKHKFIASKEVYA